MKYLIEILDRDTLYNLIVIARTNFTTMPGNELTVRDMKIMKDIKHLVYTFLKLHKLYTHEVSLFKSLVNEADIEALKEINQYNYHKLKLHKT